MSDSPPTNGLTIIIPAFNEEDAIELIIQRCLDARESIKRETGLQDVRMIVVDDGSRDSTFEKAKKYEPEITLLQHKKNKGYGAAIKYGFRESQTTLVGFLDADGTCDPLFFSHLCNRQKEKDYDVVLGNRLGPSSEMPAVRRLGNLIFATLLRILSHTRIQDTASGMRVIKRDSLPRLYPLPDGLHFTPAMSSRILFHPELTLSEVDMPYAERIGESKLSVIKDGIRFLQVILEMALIYRPLLFFGLGAFPLFLACLIYSPALVMKLVESRYLEENWIYRTLAVMTFFIAGLTLLVVGLLSQKLLAYLHDYKNKNLAFYHRFFMWLAPIGVLCLLVGVGINIKPLQEYFAMGEITHPWTFIATGALLVLTGIQLLAIASVNYVIDLVVRHRSENE